MANPVNQVFNSADPGFTLGGQQPISADWTMAPFSARAAVAVPAGSSATYGLEWTLDDVNDPKASVRWFQDGILPAGQTASGTASYTIPITFVRVNIAALSGTLEFKFVCGLPQ